MTRLILCDGVGESHPGSMLSRPDWSAFDEIIHLQWSASYGPVNPRRDPYGEAFTDALADGMSSLRHLLAVPAVVAGYSGGAAVAGHVAAQEHPNLIAVALLADPFQPRYPFGYNGPAGEAFGVAGSRPVLAKPVRWWGARDDIICNCPTDSPVRTFADQSVAFSLGDINAWQRNIVGRLKSARWQKVRINWRNPLEVIRQYGDAITGVEGYLGIGRPSPHMSYATRQPGRPTTDVQELAMWCRRFA